jgi:hypothetical protein
VRTKITPDAPRGNGRERASDGPERKERSGDPPTPLRASRPLKPDWLKRLLYCRACRAIYEGIGIEEDIGG